MGVDLKSKKKKKKSEFGVTAVAQWVKDLVLLQLWHRLKLWFRNSIPGPGISYTLGAAKKKKKKKNEFNEAIGKYSPRMEEIAQSKLSPW